MTELLPGNADTAPVLLTGAAGFIGFHVAQRLLTRGISVVGVDDVNAYYDVRLKEARLAELARLPGFRFQRLNLAERGPTQRLFEELAPRRVIHLAAQAGVRYSIDHPHAYADSNLVGFLNILEGCRAVRTAHLVYASSSSVYGANTVLPFSVQQNVDHPVSLYAATKKANELMAHSYSHLYGLPTTGLRFFTVYGPWGRPDMAVFLFTAALFAGRPIDIYNAGAMRRDFTYIDDAAEAVVRILDLPPSADPARADADPSRSRAPYRVYNVGNSEPIDLLRLVELLERLTGRTANRRLLPMPPGDVPATYADVAELARDADFAPRTPIEEGLARFVEWYRTIYLHRIAPADAAPV
ncbi:NAD-dependent epimerase/dehydratase family protein [Ancylobacter terrae]|uniref:NAD-dependent epimerase/dehydratase family protein n=1 Tax=Ancylobacter sp. sgz301288 TaxID=3342077 RepID=UPI00385E9711